MKFHKLKYFHVTFCLVIYYQKIIMLNSYYIIETIARTIFNINSLKIIFTLHSYNILLIQKFSFR